MTFIVNRPTTFANLTNPHPQPPFTPLTVPQRPAPLLPPPIPIEAVKITPQRSNSLRCRSFAELYPVQDFALNRRTIVKVPVHCQPQTTPPNTGTSPQSQNLVLAKRQPMVGIT